MNQILSTENPNDNLNDNFNDNYNDMQYKPQKSGNSNKIILIFAIAIAIFGVLILLIFGLKSMKGNEPKKKQDNIILELSENEGQAIIQVESKDGLEKLIYSWVESEETEEVPLQGMTSYEIGLDILPGENTLEVKVIDINGNEKSTSNYYIGVGDAEKPILKLETVGSKIKITAEDETEIDYISYKWINQEDDTDYPEDNLSSEELSGENLDEEVIIEAEDNPLLIEAEIEIKRGTNKIVVTAVDKAGNKTQEEKNYAGRLEPQIEVWADETKMYMKVTHDMGFESVVFAVNGEKYNYDDTYYAYDPEKVELYYSFNLKEGVNEIAIIAISNEETRAEYSGETTYP